MQWSGNIYNIIDYKDKILHEITKVKKKLEVRNKTWFVSTGKISSVMRLQT